MSLIKFILIVLVAPLVMRGHVGAVRSWTPPPLTIVITVVDAENPRAVVAGVFHQRRDEFRKSFSLSHLAGGTVRDLKLLDSENKPIGFRELAEREYLAEKEISSWSYVVDLPRLSNRGSAAHRSWLSTGNGVLMMRDLWPRVERGNDRAYLSVQVPAGWSVLKPKLANNSLISLPNSSNDWYGASVDSVFLIGKTWRQQPITEKRGGLVAVAGDWLFSDSEASQLVGEVLAQYEKRLGPVPASEFQVAISKFPTSTPPGEWQAETLGNNVMIVSSDMPFKSQSLQRLHEQLRHELFHLWIPNDVNLTGNYDWFYEGFALYESLKLAVALNRIRFEDFLDTLSRAHTIDSAGSRRVSLIEASKSRFDGTNNTQVYARGMLVAFLTDVSLLESSRGKRSIENLLRELYAKHKKPAEPVEANPAVTEMLRSNGAGAVVDRFITGTDRIEWANQLAAAGIEDADPGPLTTLRVSGKLSGRQKTLLDKLGYNNWRKLSPSSK